MRVEAREEARALVVEVVLDLEVGAEAGRRARRAGAARPNLRAHRLLGQVGDVRDHARDREPDVGPRAAP